MDPATPSPARTNWTSLRKQMMITMFLLAVQFILGMINNLFVKFPDTTDQGKLWHAAWSNWSVASHIVIGTLLTLSILVLLVRVFRTKRRPMIVLITISSIGVLLAAYGGQQFVATQKDVFSMVMAIGFIMTAVTLGQLLSAVQVAEALSGSR